MLVKTAKDTTLLIDTTVIIIASNIMDGGTCSRQILLARSVTVKKEDGNVTYMIREKCFLLLFVSRFKQQLIYLLWKATKALLE